MILSARSLWIVLGVAFLGGSAQAALSVPGVVPSTAAWSTTGTILNGSVENSSTTVNPAGTFYFFGASINSTPLIPTGQLNPDGTGHVVVSNIVIAYSPTGAAASSDVIQGQVSPLLASTPYFLYAQACPPSSDPQHPRMPNDAACSAWTLANAASIMTTAIPDPNFDAVHPSDLSGGNWGVVIPTVTLHTIASNADAQNIAYWHVQLQDLTSGGTSQILNLVGSHQKQTIFWAPSPSTNPNATSALLPNRAFKISQWFEYPFQQTSVISTGTFYTTPEPASLDTLSSPPANTPAPADNIVEITSYSVTVQYHNAVDARLANPAHSAMYGSIRIADGTLNPSNVASTGPIVGVSTETVRVRFANLLPGTTYNVGTLIPSKGPGYFDGAYWQYVSQGIGYVRTLGNPPTGFTDPIFLPVLSGDAQNASFHAKSKVPTSETDIVAWHLILKDLSRNVTSPEIVIPASRFVVYKGSWSINVSTADWTGLLPDRMQATEWLEYTSSALSAQTTIPFFYITPRVPGIPASPIVSATDHSLTIQFLNSNEPAYPNPQGTAYYLTVSQNGRTISSGKVYSPSGVSSQTLVSTPSNLSPDTVYTVSVSASHEYGNWPGASIVISTSAKTMPQDRVVTVDPISVTMSSAVATVTDVQDSTQASHVVLTWASFAAFTPWPTGQASATLPLINLLPNQTYQVQGRVCISLDDSRCTPLLPGQFTSRPAAISTGHLAGQSTSITATWQDTNPSGTVYNVQVCSVSTAPVCMAVEGSTKTASSQTVSLTQNGLLEGTTYQVKVQAINSGGAPWPNGPWSTIGQLRTPPSSTLAVVSVRYVPDGLALDNDTVCLPTSAVVEITFNRDLDPASINSSVVVQHRAFQFNGSPQVLSGNYSTTYSNAGGHFVLTVSPIGGWPTNDPIEILLRTTLRDSYPTHLATTYATTFVVSGDPTVAQHLSSFVDAQALSSVQAPANSFDANTCTVLRTRLLAPSNGLAADVNRGVGTTLLQGLRSSAEEIVSARNNQVASTSFANPISIFIPLPDHASINQGGSSQLVADQWVIAWLNPQTLQLVPLTDSVQSADGVRAMARQSGVYMLAQTYSSTDIGGAYAYPVPYRSDMPIRGITFTGLGAGSTISVYTTSGLKVKELSASAGQTQLLWDLHQERIASGVYIYKVESPAGKKFGKLIIIQ